MWALLLKIRKPLNNEYYLQPYLDIDFPFTVTIKSDCAADELSKTGTIDDVIYILGVTESPVTVSLPYN